MSFTVFAGDDGSFVLQVSDEPVGWIEGRGVGFCAFGSRLETLAGARVAHDALRRWLDRERLSGSAADDDNAGRGVLVERADGVLALGGGARGGVAGQIIDPGDRHHVAGASFAFELFLPRGVSPTRGIGVAQVMYNALAAWSVKHQREWPPTPATSGRPA